MSIFYCFIGEGQKISIFNLSIGKNDLKHKMPCYFSIFLNSCQTLELLFPVEMVMIKYAKGSRSRARSLGTW